MYNTLVANKNSIFLHFYYTPMLGKDLLGKNDNKVNRYAYVCARQDNIMSEKHILKKFVCVCEHFKLFSQCMQFKIVC